MKILGIVLALLMLLASAGIGFIGAGKAADVKGDVEKANAALKDLPAEMRAAVEKKAGGEIPSAGRLSAGRIVGMLAAVVCVALLVIMFVKKDLANAAAGAAVGLTALSAVIYPYVKVGENSGMAPRSQAIVALVLAVIGAGGALLFVKKSKA